MTIGDRIKQKRLNREWSQAYLAERAKIAQPSLCSLETNQTKPKVETLQKIAKALHCTINDLVGEEEENERVANIQ